MKVIIIVCAWWWGGHATVPVPRSGDNLVDSVLSFYLYTGLRTRAQLTEVFVLSRASFAK